MYKELLLSLMGYPERDSDAVDREGILICSVSFFFIFIVGAGAFYVACTETDCKCSVNTGNVEVVSAKPGFDKGRYPTFE